MKFGKFRTLPIIKAAVVLASGALVLTGCAGGVTGGSEKADGPIKFGMLAPFSGSEAAFGDYMKYGAQLAINEINADGGVLGQDIELVTEDDGCDATMAVAAANKLVTEGVTASVGGYCSGATLPTLPIFEKAGIPMVIPAANSNKLVEANVESVFLINGTGDQQAEAAIAYAKKIGAKSVGVIDDATAYSADLAAAFTKQAEAEGVTVSLSETITPGENDYSSVATALANTQPDLVYWTGYYQEGGLIVRQAVDAGFKGVFLLGDGSVDAKFIEIAGAEYAKNVVATFTKTPDMLEGAESWVADYEKLAGAAPGPYSIQTYDAVKVMAQAIEDAGTTDIAKVASALQALNEFPTLTGPLTFTEQRTRQGGGFVIVIADPNAGAFVLEDDLS